jgi:hypothetical protein
MSEPAKQHWGHPDVQLVALFNCAQFQQIRQLIQLLEFGGDLLIQLHTPDVILCHGYLLDVHWGQVLRCRAREDEAPGGDVES